MAKYKQVIIIRSDLKLSKGKACSQSAHAAVEAVLRSDKKKVEKWRSEGMLKVVVKVQDLKGLRLYERQAKEKDLVTAVITDAGRTVVKPGTVTCMAIGPDEDKKIDAITSKLSLL